MSCKCPSKNFEFICKSGLVRFFSEAELFLWSESGVNRMDAKRTDLDEKLQFHLEQTAAIATQLQAHGCTTPTTGETDCQQPVPGWNLR